MLFEKKHQYYVIIQIILVQWRENFRRLMENIYGNSCKTNKNGKKQETFL